MENNTRIIGITKTQIKTLENTGIIYLKDFQTIIQLYPLD